MEINKVCINCKHSYRLGRFDVPFGEPYGLVCAKLEHTIETGDKNTGEVFVKIERIRCKDARLVSCLDGKHYEEPEIRLWLDKVKKLFTGENNVS